MWLAPGHPSGWGRAKTRTQALDSSVRSFHHPFPPCLALSLVRTAPQSSSALARYLGSESFCISFLLSLCVFFFLVLISRRKLGVLISKKREKKESHLKCHTHDTFPISSHSSVSRSVDYSVPIRALWGHGDLDKCIWGPRYCGQNIFGNQNSQRPTKEVAGLQTSPRRTPGLHILWAGGLCIREGYTEDELCQHLRVGGDDVCLAGTECTTCGFES